MLYNLFGIYYNGLIHRGRRRTKHDVKRQERRRGFSTVKTDADEIPKDEEQLRKKGILSKDESILFRATQVGFKKLIHPKRLIITDKQIIFYTPKWIGHKIESYGLRADRRLLDITVENYIRTSSIMMTTMSDSATFKDLPRHAAVDALYTLRGVSRDLKQNF